MDRRRFLAWFGVSSVTVPLVAKATMEEGAAKLAGMNVSGVGDNYRQATGHTENVRFFDEPAAIKAVMQIPQAHAALTSAVFDEFRHVSFIDPDLAVKRSFSLNAKIAFQRQRNVQHSLENRLAGHEALPYNRVRKLLEKAAGWVPFQVHKLG